MKNVEDWSLQVREHHHGSCAQIQVGRRYAEYSPRFRAEKRTTHVCAWLPLPETIVCGCEVAQSTECPARQHRCGHSIVHVRCFGEPSSSQSAP